MDERPDEIIGHIEAQRSQLGRNLNELETRVRESTDWRTYFDRNPMLMLGAALGGGLLLGSMVGSKQNKRSGYSGKSYRQSSSSASAMGLASAGIAGSAASGRSHNNHQLSQLSQTMDHVKTALVAFGIAKAKEFLNQAIPGFEHHLSHAEQKHHSGAQHGHEPVGAQNVSQFNSGLGGHESGSQGNAGNWESDLYRSGSTQTDASRHDRPVPTPQY